MIILRIYNFIIDPYESDKQHLFFCYLCDRIHLLLGYALHAMKVEEFALICKERKMNSLTMMDI